MTDIRDITQSVLDDVFFGTVPVYAEDSDPESGLPEEYIVHDVVYSLPHEWADGRVLSVREGVDVSYYCKTRSKKTVRLRRIHETMLAAGFLPVEGFADLPRGEQTGYYGANAEYVMHRVVTDDGG